MRRRKPFIAVLYNHVGEDEYEQIRQVDPRSLDFKPAYSLNVATIQDEYDAIVQALKREGFRAKAYNVDDRLETLEHILRREHPDAVFNLIEHFHDEAKNEFLVAGLYDLYRIPFTGAPPFALALCQRKGMTKQLLLANGIRTPRFKLLFEPHMPRRHGLHYPLIVKPAREDASSGVSKGSVVFELPQLLERAEAAFKEFAPPILVEEFIEGRELHVAILGNDPPRALPILEYDFSELPPEYPPIISYEAKWDPLKEEYHRIHSICPAKLPRRIEKKVIARAIESYRLTGCRDYARIDMRLSKENKVYVLEVNPNPDLTEGVSFMECAQNAGLNFGQTLKMIAEFALARAASSTKPVAASNPS
jgi:D-alanine-D-alanine ligase